MVRNFLSNILIVVNKSKFESCSKIKEVNWNIIIKINFLQVNLHRELPNVFLPHHL